MFNDDDPEAHLVADGSDQFDHPVQFGFRQARGQLVQEEHPGPAGEGAGQIQALELDGVEALRRRVDVLPELNEIQHFHGLCLGVPVPVPVPAEHGAHQDVLQRGKPGEGPGNLEGAGQPHAADLVGLHPGGVMAQEADRTRGRLVGARQTVQERGLPRAVRPDEADDLVGRHMHGDLGDGRQPAELLGDIPRV